MGMLLSRKNRVKSKEVFQEDTEISLQEVLEKKSEDFSENILEEVKEKEIVVEENIDFDEEIFTNNEENIISKVIEEKALTEKEKPKSKFKQ